MFQFLKTETTVVTGKHLVLFITKDYVGFCITVLKSDLMAALNKEVKSLDEDNWKFDGPRSRIHLISRPG